MNTNTSDFQVADAVEYIDAETGTRYTGTVLAVDYGSGWSESRIQVQWDDMQATWVRASTLRLLS